MRKTNHLAILILVIFHQTVGFVWYSKYFFGNAWMRGLNRTYLDFNIRDPLPFIAAILTAILFLYGLDLLMKKTGWINPIQGAILALMLWFFFIAPSLFTHYQFLGISKTVFAIDAFMLVILYFVDGIVLGAWKRTA